MMRMSSKRMKILINWWNRWRNLKRKIHSYCQRVIKKKMERTRIIKKTMLVQVKMRRRKKRIKITIQSHKKFPMCLTGTKISSMAKTSHIMTDKLYLCFLYAKVSNNMFKYKFNIMWLILPLMIWQLLTEILGTSSQVYVTLKVFLINCFVVSYFPGPISSYLFYYSSCLYSYKCFFILGYILCGEGLFDGF